MVIAEAGSAQTLCTEVKEVKNEVNRADRKIFM